jgi:hypothetical protein
MPPSSSAEATEAVRGELEANERLLWAGTPARGLRWGSGDFVPVFMGLSAAGIGAAWGWVMVTHSAKKVLAAALGMLFVLVGAYLAFARFFADARRRAVTVYGLTDRRVLIVWGGSTRYVQDLALREIHDVSVTEGPDGTGTLTFNRAQRGYGRSTAPTTLSLRAARMATFQMIPDARAVSQEIHRACMAEIAGPEKSPGEPGLLK